MSRSIVSSLVALVGALALASASNALTFDVTTTDDNPDAAIDGVCADATEHV